VLRAVHFGESPGTCYTVAKDGAVFAWEFESDKPGSKAAAVFSPAFGKWKLKGKHVSTLRTQSSSTQKPSAGSFLLVWLQL
jgi:hypothetical protein